MQLTPTTLESIKPLLRPDQAAEAQKDIRNAEAKLESPHIEDKREARNQLIRLRKTATEQFPKPPESAEQEGQMQSRSQALLDHIVSDGMLSQAEMRACPPGAPDQHLSWERRNKAAILEWKNLQLRLKPGEREAANLERHRPTAGRLNLDNSVVERKVLFNVENVTGATVTFTDEELIALQAISPDDRARVPSMSNEERQVWKKMVVLMMEKGAPEPVVAAPNTESLIVAPKQKYQMTQEHKDKMKAARESKKAA